MNAGDVLVNSVAGVAAGFVGSMIISLIRTPKLLDNDREMELTRARSIIETQTARIAALEAKPARTYAEQHHYDFARTAVEKHSDAGVAVLRHLRLHRRLLFSFTNAPPSPPGMTTETHRDILNSLVKSNVVQMVPQTLPGGYEYTYLLTPGLENAMDELLY